MPKCRATRAFTWFSNMLLIYRELYHARVKGMSIEAKDQFRRIRFDGLTKKHPRKT